MIIKLLKRGFKRGPEILWFIPFALVLVLVATVWLAKQLSPDLSSEEIDAKMEELARTGKERIIHEDYTPLARYFSFFGPLWLWQSITGVRPGSIMVTPCEDEEG